MASGLIKGISSPLPDGLAARLEALGVVCSVSPDGLIVSDVAAAQAFINRYTGSVEELAFSKARQQTALDEFFNAHFDLAAFIRGGATTGLTGAQVGTFLAAIANNYRTLRVSIASAANVAAVNAVNVSSGWPANP